MADHLFTLALNTEELIEKARELSELSELNGIPTFSLDAILELINKNLIKNINHENLQNLLVSILGEASTDLTDAIHAELYNLIDADPPDTNSSPNKSPFTISPYSYTGIVTEAVTTSLPTSEWFTTPFSSFALGTSPSFQVTVKFDIPDENTSIDEATKEILKSLDDVGGYSFDVKLELDLSNIACSASDSETLNTLIANNFIVARNPIGAMTLTYFNQQLTSDGQYAVLIDAKKYRTTNDLRFNPDEFGLGSDNIISSNLDDDIIRGMAIPNTEILITYKGKDPANKKEQLRYILGRAKVEADGKFEYDITEQHNSTEVKTDLDILRGLADTIGEDMYSAFEIIYISEQGSEFEFLISEPFPFKIDIIAPTLTIECDTKTLKAGESVTITFRFSEDPGNTFTDSDIKVEGGTLSSVSAGAGLTRTAIFTPEIGLDKGEASISVAAKSYADLAGNPGAAVTSLELTYDTLAPTVSITTPISGGYLNSTEDDTNLTIAGTSSGADGQTVTLNLDGNNYTTNYTTTVANGGAWAVTVSPSVLQALAEGTISLTANVSDAAGNAATTATASYIYDISAEAPSFSLNADTGISPTDYLSNDATVNVTLASDVDTWAYSIDGGSSWTKGVGTSFVLPEGTYVSSKIQLKQIDQAGNTSVSAANSDPFTVDLTEPSVIGVSISGTDNILATGEKVTVTMLTSEAVVVSGTPSYRINLGGVEKAAIFKAGSGTKSLLFEYEIAPGDVDAAGGITAAANALDVTGATLTDKAGNNLNLATAAITSDTNTITVDTIPPRTPTLNIVAGDDLISTAEKLAGISLSGTAEPYSSVVVDWGDKASRTTQTLSNGNWSLAYSASQIPKNGKSKITLLSVDAAGNKSAPTSREVTIDSENLSPNSLLLKPGSGISNQAQAGDTSVFATLIGSDPDGDPLIYALGQATAFNDNALVELDEIAGTIRLKNEINANSLSKALKSGSLRISATAKEAVEGRANPLSISRTLLIAAGNTSNKAPEAIGTTATLSSVLEGSTATNIKGQLTSYLFSSLFRDTKKEGDANSLENKFAGVAIIGNDSETNQGTWQYRKTNTSNWVDLPSISEENPFIIQKNDLLRFVPSKSFSGTPGNLNVRLLEDSRLWSTGTLSSNDVLAVGGFGSASAEVVALKTTITPVPKSPTALYLEAPDGVPSSPSNTAFAVASAVDPDSPTQELKYALESAISGNKVNLTSSFAIDPTTGKLRLVGNGNDVRLEKSITLRLQVADAQISDVATPTSPLTKSFTFGVLNDSNIAPKIKNDDIVSIASSLEGASAPSFSSVADLFLSHFSDTPALQQVANGTDFAGVAVVSNSTQIIQGVWQYRFSSQDKWTALPSLSDERPFILPAAAQLRFYPRPGFSGTPGNLTVRLLDGSQNWTPGLLSSSTPLVIGGSGAAGSSTLQLGTSITAIPKAPNTLSLQAGAVLKGDTIFYPLIGQFKATDLDSKSSDLKFTLASPTPKNDNALLSIGSDGTLQLAPSIDQSALDAVRKRGYLQVTAIVKDEGDRSREASFKIAAENDLNRAPIALAQEAQLPDWAPVASSDILSSRIYFYDSKDTSQLQGSTPSSLTQRTVRSLFGGNSTFSDPSSDKNPFNAFAGIAVVSNDALLNPLNGRWQYQLADGSWKSMPPVSEDAPLLLQANTSIRFLASGGFSGTPGALKVRLLDDSFDFSDGLLPPDTALVSGVSGAASANTFELVTYVTPTENPPTSIFFATARSILLDGNGDVAGGTLLGSFTAVDKDTKIEDLGYTIVKDIDNALDLSGNKIIDNLEIVNGNELRVKDGSTVKASDLQKLRLQARVYERGNEDNYLESDINQPFMLSTRSFTTTPDLTPRSDTSVLPSLTNDIPGFNVPVLFSATGVSGAISVEQGPILSTSDMGGFSAADLNLNLAPGEQLSQVTPLAPMLNFNLAVDNPGDVVRFEFELPLLSYTDLLGIQYMKLLGDGSLSVFDYLTDDFGVSTGARLETKGPDGYTALTSSNYNPSDPMGSPAYLAIYVQDNGRGDDDIRLGMIRDPGAPFNFNFGIKAAAEQAKLFNLSLDPKDTIVKPSDYVKDGVADVFFDVYREAKFDNVVNFYRVVDENGSIRVPGTEDIIDSTDSRYFKLALDPSNTLLALDGSKPSLQTKNNDNGLSDQKNIKFSLDDLWVPYVYVINTGQTYLPFPTIGDDNYLHFQSSKTADAFWLHLEDLPGGGDRDHDDLFIRLSTSFFK